MAFHTVPNGKTTVHFTIPAGVDATIVETNPLPRLADPAEAIRRAILNPIVRGSRSSPPTSRGSSPNRSSSRS
jgi:hypothetical protein